jgi:hypothetical protein
MMTTFKEHDTTILLKDICATRYGAMDEDREMAMNAFAA